MNPAPTSSPAATTPPVLIIGGGLAGLATAVGLAQHGVRSVILEARDRLGGRASSFVDPETGESIDNCQHVGMGCCTNLQHFCRTVGVDHLFRVEDELTFIDPEGQSSRLFATLLPCPLHLARAFAGLKYLTWNEKRLLATGLARLARWRPAATLPLAPGGERAGVRGENVPPLSSSPTRQRPSDSPEAFIHWLHRNGQTPRLIERFWEVVLVSALSESLNRIDIGHARKVFVDGFLRHRDGWRVHIPTVPLDQIFGQPVASWLESHGCAMRYHSAVRRLHGDCSRITGVELRSGETVTVDEIVLAVPHGRVLDLLPEEVAALAELRHIQEIESAPITSLHLWFDRPITDLPHAVLIGRLSQWIFRHPGASFAREQSIGGDLSLGNCHLSLAIEPTGTSAEPTTITNDKSAMTNDQSPPAPQPPPPNPYQVVISASRALQGRSRESICDEVLSELRAIWPAARDAQRLRWKLVTERQAVFSVTPGIESLRPPQQSPVPNLQLAGDWTATGWPATMESAVRSGYLAAENILKRRGITDRLLQFDQPASRLSRLLFGL